MRQILTEIQDGTYAKNWIAENQAGRPWFNATRRREQDQLIEQVGAQLRSLMPFLDPIDVREETRQPTPEPATQAAGSSAAD